MAVRVEVVRTSILLNQLVKQLFSIISYDYLIIIIIEVKDKPCDTGSCSFVDESPNLYKPQLAPQEVLQGKPGDGTGGGDVVFVRQTQQVKTHHTVYIEFAAAVTDFGLVELLTLLDCILQHLQ